MSHRTVIVRLLATGTLLIFLVSGGGTALSATMDWTGGPSANLPIVTVAGTQETVAAIPDGLGGMIVVWEDARSGNTDIYAHHVLKQGSLDPAWPATGLPVCVKPANQVTPVLCTDGAGGAYVVWTDHSQPGAAELTAHHLLTTGKDPEWGENGQIVAFSAFQHSPKIASDGASGAFVTWDNQRLGDAQHVVFLQHLIRTGIDPKWSADGVAACSAVASSQRYPVICSDGTGGAIVAWTDNRTPASSVDIYAQRMNAAGDLLWPAAGVPACTATGIQRLNGSGSNLVLLRTTTDVQANAIVPDGAGGCFVTWLDDRTVGTTSNDVYAQHLTSSGAVSPGWPASGAAMCTAAGSQHSALILAAGAGGAIVVWNDTRPGTFAQHVSSTGSVSGPAGGIVVDLEGTGYPVAVGDGAGGAIVYYYQSGGASGLDAYAQHLRTFPSFGIDPAWPANGVALSTAANDQTFGAIVTDQSGGAIAAWYDARNSGTSGFDIYAQRVESSGSLPTDPASVPVGKEHETLLQSRPHPFQSDTEIQFRLAERSRVRIELYDISGAKRRELLNTEAEAGEHSLRLSRDHAPLAPGLYYLRMTGHSLTSRSRLDATRTLVVLR